MVETKKETEKTFWKCPHCHSSAIALDVMKEHQNFGDEYRSLEQMIRCCNCDLQFVFEYELKRITVHSFRNINARGRESIRRKRGGLKSNGILKNRI